jgi:hypothetical protein
MRRRDSGAAEVKRAKRRRTPPSVLIYRVFANPATRLAMQKSVLANNALLIHLLRK